MKACGSWEWNGKRWARPCFREFVKEQVDAALGNTLAFGVDAGGFVNGDVARRVGGTRLAWVISRAPVSSKQSRGFDADVLVEGWFVGRLGGWLTQGPLRPFLSSSTAKENGSGSVPLSVSRPLGGREVRGWSFHRDGRHSESAVMVSHSNLYPEAA
jgi:hypothetical protein